MNFQKNILFVIAASLRSVALLCVTGSVMQTFIESCGLGSNFNYFHTTFLQVINIIFIILCSRFADRGNVFLKVLLLNIVCGFLFIMYIPLCIPNNSFMPAIPTILSCGFLQMTTVALYTVCEYKIPYKLFTSREYGVIISACGIAGSSLSILFCAAITFFAAKYEYRKIMVFAFLLACVCMLASGVLTVSLTPAKNKTIETKKNTLKIPLKSIFKEPVFYKLLLPTLFRGFGVGTTTVLTILAFQIGYKESTVLLMTTLSTISFFVANFMFGIMSTRFSLRHIILFSSLTFLTLPLIFLENEIIFIVVYSIVICGRTVADSAVPTALMKVVPEKIAGPYNAWRMIIHTCGTVIATSVASFISPYLLILITILLYLTFSVSYFFCKELRV